MDSPDVALLQLRSLISLVLLAIFPVSASADDNAARAVLHSSGGVQVNHQSPPSSIAVFSGDIVETQQNGTAMINFEGSSAEIDPQTVIELKDGEIILDHGSLTVITLRQLRVRAGCVLATPVALDSTIYTVRDTDHRVTVFAKKHDVNLDSHSAQMKRASESEKSGHAVVHQDEQKSRDEHCGGGDLQRTPVAATGGILNSPYAVAGGGIVITGGTLCILLCFNDDPPSPASPSWSSITANHP